MEILNVWAYTGGKKSAMNKFSDLSKYNFCPKVERKKQEEKMRRDQLNDQYLDLIEKQRLYFKTVKDFKEVSRYTKYILIWKPKSVV